MTVPNTRKPGDVIQLQGITGHGRNRIREHGERWRVLDLLDLGFAGPLTSTPIMSCETGYTLWLHSHSDSFQVMKDTDDD